MGQGPFLCLEQVFASRACLTPDHREPGNDPGMGGNGTIEEAYGASQIFTKNKSRVVWVWGGQPVVNQPSSPLPPEPRRQQLVAVLIAARTKWGQ